MKLIFCPECRDIIRLFIAKKEDFRYCRCTKSWGRYLPCGRIVEIGGLAIPIGIQNTSFKHAIMAARNIDTTDIVGSMTGKKFDAFVIPVLCATVRRVEK